MLFLLFQLGRDRYAIDTTKVVEVLPLVDLKELPQAPAGVAGTLNYRGTPVPVIDLAQFALGRPSERWMSTRIILVNYTDPDGGTNLLGVLAENTTGTLRCQPSDFVDHGVTVDATPYLGPVLADRQGMIQRVEIDQLLPESLREILFRQPDEGS